MTKGYKTRKRIFLRVFLVQKKIHVTLKKEEKFNSEDDEDEKNEN